MLSRKDRTAYGLDIMSEVRVSCMSDEGCSSVFFQAEDGIRDLVRSRGLGDVYKRQSQNRRRQNWPAAPSRCWSARCDGQLKRPGIPGNLSLIHI